MNMTGETKEIPKGSIQCLKCKSINGFVLHYPNGCKAIFAYSGLSKDEQAIYIITHTTQLWKKGMTPKSVTCGNCAKGIPFWMLGMNRYVRSAHTT